MPINSNFFTNFSKLPYNQELSKETTEQNKSFSDMSAAELKEHLVEKQLETRTKTEKLAEDYSKSLKNNDITTMFEKDDDAILAEIEAEQTQLKKDLTNNVKTGGLASMQAQLLIAQSNIGNIDIKKIKFNYEPKTDETTTVYADEAESMKKYMQSIDKILDIELKPIKLQKEAIPEKFE